MSGSLVDVGIAHAIYAGEVETGDRCVVRETDRCCLVAVIDGIGHGPRAAAAAAAAAAVLEAYAGEQLDELLRRCHERLSTTRGAAITLALLDARDGLLKWVGAGNVAAVLLRTEPSGRLRAHDLLVRGGVAGGDLPVVAVSSRALEPGDVIVLATDGVRRSFPDGVDRVERPQRLAERLLTQYGTADDDALVVVVRLRGSLR